MRAGFAAPGLVAGRLLGWPALPVFSRSCAERAFANQWDEHANDYEAYHRLRALRAHLRVPFQALGRVPDELCPEDLLSTLNNVKRYFES